MMNAPNPRELLTAALDGELSPADRKAAQQLLRESEAARTLFAQLKADVARLKKLPRFNAPADLADHVLATIQDRAMTPTPLPPSRPPTRRFNWSALPVWANVATAAAVLLTISAGSYLYFAASQDYWAKRDQNKVASGPAATDATSGSLSEPGGRRETTGVAPKSPDRIPAEAVAVGPPEIGPEVGPAPRVRDDIQLSPPRDEHEIESFQLDKIRVSRLFTLHDLPDDEAARTKLAAEMKKDELIRLDLFCESTPGALDRLLAALKGRGIAVFSDAFAVEQLKKKARTEVMIFTEALTPDEVAHLMSALGAEDKKGSRQLGTLVAAPFLPADLTRLSRLLGIPTLDPKPAKGKAAIDIRKPLPEGTAKQVAEMLALVASGSGNSAKPKRSAVVVSYSPGNPLPGASAEIRQFLERRGERRADAKPLMLVLRTTR